MIYDILKFIFTPRMNMLDGVFTVTLGTLYLMNEINLIPMFLLIILFSIVSDYFERLFT
jgi:hypothetical protein